MGFWMFMLVMDLLIPAVMIGFGWIFIHKTPKEINSLYGYRTFMSMINKETWNFAHQYIGKLWYRWGWILLPISLLTMLPVLGKNADAVGTWGGVLCFAQMIPLFGTIWATETALKKQFDKKGNKKQDC